MFIGHVREKSISCLDPTAQVDQGGQHQNVRKQDMGWAHHLWPGEFSQSGIETRNNRVLELLWVPSGDVSTNGIEERQIRLGQSNAIMMVQ